MMDEKRCASLLERLRVGESIDVVAKEVTGRFYRYTVPAEEFQAPLRVDKSAERLLPGSFCGKTRTCLPAESNSWIQPCSVFSYSYGHGALRCLNFNY